MQFSRPYSFRHSPQHARRPSPATSYTSPFASRLKRPFSSRTHPGAVYCPPPTAVDCPAPTATNRPAPAAETPLSDLRSSTRAIRLLHFHLSTRSYLYRSQRPHCTKIAQLRAQLANTCLQQTNSGIFPRRAFIRLPCPSHGVLELADEKIDLHRRLRFRRGEIRHDDVRQRLAEMPHHGITLLRVLLGVQRQQLALHRTDLGVGFDDVGVPVIDSPSAFQFTPPRGGRRKSRNRWRPS